MLGAVIALSLAGLAAVQFVLLRKAIGVEADAFQRNAVVALSRAADELTADEILRVIIASAVDSLGADSGCQVAVDSIVTSLRSTYRSDTGEVVMIKQDTTIASWSADSTLVADNDRHNQVHIELQIGNIDEVAYSEDSLLPRRMKNATNYTLIDGTRRHVQYVAADSIRLSSSEVWIQSLLSLPDVPDDQRAVFVMATLSQLEDREAIPVLDRVDTLQLDSAIYRALNSEGIDLDYRFGIVDAADNKPLFLEHDADTTELANSTYRTRLFPHDIISRPHELVAYFPAKQAYLMRQMVPVAVPAGLFMLVIAAGFVYTIRVIMNQQRFAGRLRDFINNMTHEFKTPISTIQLASEALRREDVQSDRRRIDQFNKMIGEENRRMKLQVDKILQMAVIEDGALEVKREPVDLHIVVQSAIDAARLNVERVGGTIDYRMEANPHVVDGDEVHLYNIVANLLDNACKYSNGAPDIRVTTERSGNTVRLRVADRGIGIDEADQKRVFERYYRVATGDRHDVKGFGLGLAYVKLVSESLRGSVKVNSTLGVGTEIVIALPLAEQES